MQVALPVGGDAAEEMTARRIVRNDAVEHGIIHNSWSAGERRGISGRIFTILIAAGPAFWLFHPPFVRNVILPFMKAIGAL